MASPYAFVTLLTSDHYLPGALSLVAALRDVHPSPATSPEHEFQTVCIVTPETVDVSTIKLLRKAFDVVIGVELIVQNDQEGLKLLGRPDLNEVLTKLHVFRLTQYEKIIFLDADVLPIRPLSHLFTTPHEFSAVPDVGWPDIFNSGVLVLSPGEEKFSELQELLKSKGSWDGGDQGILNEWRGDNWNKLSFTYNTTPTAAYTYAPAYERFGKQISAIHFIGPNKPWKSIQYRAPFVSQEPAQNPSSQRAYDYDSLVDKWFDVYDKHYRAQSIIPEAHFEVQKYESAWNEHNQTGTPAPVGQGGALGLEELRRLAIQGINSAGLAVENRSGEGEYQSFPLEGRVDLMRPQPPPPKAPEVQYSAGLVADNMPNEGEYKILSLENRMDSMRSQPPPPRMLEVQASLQSSGHSSPGTPRLNEISPKPHPHPVPLPSPHFEHQEHHDHHGPVQQHQHSEQHSLHFTPPQEQPSVDSYSQSPPRPPSPPKLLWNPAIEPPPNIAPPLSAFPVDTYFQNIWDKGPSKQHDRAHITSPTPDSGAFFHPPPPSQIPERIKDHYRNVTGESPSAEPNPDLNKVKPIFPWEAKPRSKPGRVFPISDAPSPTWLESLGEEHERPSSPKLVTEVFSPPPPPKPPLPRGLPTTLSYANAWDTVPSIQRYASRLVRSPPAPPVLPSFDDDNDYRQGRKNWDERTEASSRDGDDEDNTDSDDGAPVVSRLADSDDDTSASGATSHSWARRGSLVSASYGIKSKKKEYRVRGVQTIFPEMREQAVQVSILVDSPKVPITPKQEQKNTFNRPTRASSLSLQTGNSKKPHWAPPSTVLPPVVSRGREGPPDLKITIGTAMGPSSGDDRTSRFSPPPDALAPSVPARSNSSSTVTPFSMNALSAQRVSTSTGSPQSFGPAPLGPSREPSNESMTPPSSTGPLSPPEGQPISSIASPRRAGRVFDPARGVEVFKRGSEEVLARFLKMSSWEEDSSPQR